MKHTFVVFIFSFFLFVTKAYSQSESLSFAFKITDVRQKNKSIVTFRIEHGKDLNIDIGSEGEVWGIERKEVPGHVQLLGYAHVLESGGQYAVIECESDKNILAGDLIFLQASFPTAQYRSPYHYLSQYAIEMRDDNGQPFYSFEDIYQRDGHALQTQKFLQMQQFINAFGEQLKNKNDKRKVKAGPNAGELVSKILASADTFEIWNYLYYKSMSYMTTMGQTYKFSSDFASYVEEGDLILPDVLWRDIKNSSDDGLETLFRQYKNKITSEQLSSWLETVRELARNGEYDEAQKQLNKLGPLAGWITATEVSAEIFNLKAALFYIQGNYDEAIIGYESADKLFKTLPLNSKHGGTLYYLANCYKEKQRYDDALSSFKRCVVVREALLKSDPANDTFSDDLYSAMAALGDLQSSLKTYEDARQSYLKAFETASKGANKLNVANALWNLGYVYGDGLKEFDPAFDYYSRGLKLFEELNDTSSTIQLIRNKALLYNRRGQYGEAIKLGQQGLSLAQQSGKVAEEKQMHDFLVLAYENNKQFDEVVNHHRTLQKLYERESDAVNVIETKKKIGKAFAEMKKYDLALKEYQERAVLIRENSSTKADALWDIAYLVGENFKDDKGAIKYYEQCATIYRELKDTSNLCIVFANIGYHYRVLKDSVKTYQYHNSAIQLTRNCSDKNNYGYSLEKAAKSYAHFGNDKKELECYRAAQDAYLKIDNYAKAALMADNIGETLTALKKYDESVKSHQRAIELYHQAGDKANEASSLWDYSFIVGTNLGRFEEAIANYGKAYTLYMEVNDSINASTMLSNIGQCSWSLYNYNQAIEYHRKAIDLASKSKNMQQVAKSWSKLAQLYTESNNPVASFEALKNSVAALEIVRDSAELANTYNDIANSYVKAKDYKQGFGYFDKAIAIRSARKDKAALGVSYFDAGYAYHTKNEYANAEKFYLKALAIRRELKDREGEIYCLSNLGGIEQAIKANYKKALEYLEEAIRIAKELKDEGNIAFCYGRLKGLYRAQGKAALADQYGNEALALYQKNRRWRDVASMYVDIGYDAHYVYGNVSTALDYFDKAQVILDSIPDNNLQASIYSSRSSVYRETGEFDKAIEMSVKSLKIFQDMESNWGIASTYIDLGNIYKQRSELERAIQYQTKSDSLYKLMGLEYARLAPLANLGENYVAQGDYRKGLEFYHQSFAIMEKAGDLNENLAIIKACIGESHFYLNDFVQADKWLKEALAVCDKVGAMRPKADNLTIMARLKLEEKKYEEAMRYINDGINLSKSSGMTVAYLGNILLLGKAYIEQKIFDKAKSPIEESIKLSKSIGKRSTLWEALYLMGLWYKNAGDLKNSKEYLKESVAVIEQIRNQVSGGDEARKLFSSDKNILKVYDALIDVLLQLGETEEAMTYLQKNNEDNLKAKFKSLDVKFENEERKRALEEEKVMKAKLDGLEEQISREKGLAAEKQNQEKLKNLQEVRTIAESEYLKFINQQINVQPELSRYFNNSVQPTQFRKVKKQIPKDMALLSYLVGENQLYIFAATTDTVVAKIVAVSGETVAKDVNAVLNITKSQLGLFSQLDLKYEEAERNESVDRVQQKDQYLKPFEELYHYLINPVYKEIIGKKRLGIIPTGALNYIPFQLLGKTTSSGKFSLLANQFAVFYTSSTDMLFRMMQEDEKDMSILAFGNPDKSLPATETEVQDIKKLFPNATVFVRDDATEDKAKFAGEQFNVMHFATHGNLDYEDFSKSFLTMARNPAKAEDGMLTLEELWGMDVMTHLNIVVLSACQTAVTKGSHESSPVSPASGFLQNGVKSVVATLWKVDDNATSLLVSEFYKNLKSMDAIDALRNAQVKLSQTPKYSHPYYWAGIVLLGDWR